MIFVDVKIYSLFDKIIYKENIDIEERFRI